MEQEVIGMNNRQAVSLLKKDNENREGPNVVLKKAEAMMNEIAVSQKDLIIEMWNNPGQIEAFFDLWGYKDDYYQIRHKVYNYDSQVMNLAVEVYLP